MSHPFPSITSSFDELQSRLGRRRGGSVQLRQAALEHFARLGFPTTRSEAWRATPLGPVVETPFALAGFEGVGVARQLLRGEDGREFRLVFVDGHHDGSLSARMDLPAGTTVENLADVLLHWPDVLEPHLGRYASFHDNAFTALNTAFLEDGAFVHVPHGVHVARPLVLRYVSTPARRSTAAHPRNLLVLEPHSRAIVVEHYSGEGRNLTNAVTEVVLGEGARLEYYLLVDEGEAAFHIGRVQVEQGPGSAFEAHAVTLGSALCRTELHAHLAAERAACALRGLYLAHGRQHVDNLVRVERAAAGVTAQAAYRGVLEGRATGVFTGQLEPGEGVGLSHRALLLSDEATLDARPEVSTVERVDPAEQGALRAKGMGEAAARAVPARAFIEEVLAAMPLESWRERVRAVVEAALPGGHRRFA